MQNEVAGDSQHALSMHVTTRRKEEINAHMEDARALFMYFNFCVVHHLMSYYG